MTNIRQEKYIHPLQQIQQLARKTSEIIEGARDVQEIQVGSKEQLTGEHLSLYMSVDQQPQ